MLPVEGNVVLAETYRTRIGARQPDDHVERRGLPGAVRAEQPDHLALLNRNVDVTDDGSVLVRLPDSNGLEHDRHFGFDYRDFRVRRETARLRSSPVMTTLSLSTFQTKLVPVAIPVSGPETVAAVPTNVTVPERCS